MLDSSSSEKQPLDGSYPNGVVRQDENITNHHDSQSSLKSNLDENVLAKSLEMQREQRQHQNQRDYQVDNDLTTSSRKSVTRWDGYLDLDNDILSNRTMIPGFAERLFNRMNLFGDARDEENNKSSGKSRRKR